MSLGDGHRLDVAGEGVVSLKTKLPDGSFKKCKLLDVFYVPELAYNLLSVPRAAENGKTTKFDKNGCHVFDKKRRVIATGLKCENLYYLDCQDDSEAHIACRESKEIFGTGVMVIWGCKVSKNLLVTA